MLRALPHVSLHAFRCIPLRFCGASEALEVLLVSSRGKGENGFNKASDGKGYCFPKVGAYLEAFCPGSFSCAPGCRAVGRMTRA